jgi:hypothetical protein
VLDQTRRSVDVVHMVGGVRLSAIEQLGGGIVNGAVSWVPCYQKEGSSLAGMVRTRWCPRVHASVRQVSEGGGEG